MVSQIESNDKLYVITRRDLDPGYQAVQGQHAAIDFILEHPEISKHWHKVSNYLGFLSVENECQLFKLLEWAAALDIKFTMFKEPDIDNELTAIALEPGEKTKRLCSHLPLALKETINKTK